MGGDGVEAIYLSACRCCKRNFAACDWALGLVGAWEPLHWEQAALPSNKA